MLDIRRALGESFTTAMNSRSCSKHEATFGLVTWAKGDECPACFAFSIYSQTKKREELLKDSLELLRRTAPRKEGASTRYSRR